MKSIEILNNEEYGVVELGNNESLLVSGGGILAWLFGYYVGSCDSDEGRAVAKAMHVLPK